jgi:hypothetical protein
MGIPMPDMGVSNAVLGLANAGIVLVVYGASGPPSDTGSHADSTCPASFSEDGNWHRWFVIPLFWDWCVG